MGYQAVTKKKTVALVLGADITDTRKSRGGVVVVASFLYQQLLNSGRYIPHFVSMATSFFDKSSLRLFSPATWMTGPQLTNGEWVGIPYTHAGAILPEFEFQRYMPRKKLTDFLNQYDLVQVVSGTPALAYATKYVDVPVCLFVATMANLERKSMLRKSSLHRKIYSYAVLPIVSIYESQALKYLDHVFAETLYTKQSLVPYLDEAKITIDTIGIDTQRFKPIRERNDSYILCTGRLSDPRKNVRMLFKAYAHLRRQLPGAPKLVLAGGSGPTASDWECAREWGIRDFVEFHHEVSTDELVALYQNAAVFVLSSNEEGLGIVLLEAMACGTPVVSTQCGGPDTVVSDDIGFLTPVGDAEAMAERILTMLQNPNLRRRMGEMGRQMVEQRFSTTVVGQKYLDVYDRLLCP